MDVVTIIDRDAIGSLFLATVTALLAAWVLCGDSGRRWAKPIAAAGLIAYLVHRWNVKPPKYADQVQDALLRSLVCAGMTYAAARFALTLLIAVWEATVGRLIERYRTWAEEAKREAEERDKEAQQEAARRQRDEEARNVRPAVIPPPPTTEERAAAAKARYEARLRFLDAAPMTETERQSARDQAKAKYLREIDEVMS